MDRLLPEDPGEGVGVSDLCVVGASGAAGAHFHLRFQNHLTALGKLGRKYALIPDGADLEEASKWLLRADIFHGGQGCGWSLASQYLRFRDDFYEMEGKYIPIVWDVDDNPETISPWNAAYDAFGEEDVSIVSPETGKETWLWKDGVDGFDITRNKANLYAYRFMISYCDAVTTTCEHLRELLRRYNKHVELVPNRINFDLFKIRNTPQNDGKVRILYQGGSSHFRDWKFIAPALQFLTKKYPHIRIVCMGNVGGWAKADLGEEFVEDRNWSNDYKSFCLRMGTMGVDMAIAPLYLDDDMDRDFSLCKSNLKWLDYGAVGIPTVAQKCVVYEDIHFSEDTLDIAWDGMLAGTVDEWITCLSLLIENPDLRFLMGNNAYNTVRKHWNAAHCGQQSYDMYERIHQRAKWRGRVPPIDARDALKEEVTIGR